MHPAFPLHEQMLKVANVKNKQNIEKKLKEKRKSGQDAYHTRWPTQGVYDTTSGLND